MKIKLILLIIAISAISVCKSQTKIQMDCLSQENMRKVYFALKAFILKNSEPKTEYENYTASKFQYDSINFSHRLVPNNNKKGHPKFNMETIEVSGNGISYTLIYGGHFGDTGVSLEIKDFSEEKGKIIQQKAEQHFCNVISKMNFDIKISAKEAIDIAARDSKETFGGLINQTLENHYWHITSTPVGRNAPQLYIIDANDGKIVLKLDNSGLPEQQKKLKEFISGKENK